jgi:hypothetical protein
VCLVQTLFRNIQLAPHFYTLQKYFEKAEGTSVQFKNVRSLTARVRVTDRKTKEINQNLFMSPSVSSSSDSARELYNKK